MRYADAHDIKIRGGLTNVVLFCSSVPYRAVLKLTTLPRAPGNSDIDMYCLANFFTTTIQTRMVMKIRSTNSVNLLLCTFRENLPGSGFPVLYCSDALNLEQNAHRIL